MVVVEADEFTVASPDVPDAVLEVVDEVPVVPELEVAVLSRTNGRRAFRRIEDDELATLLL